MARWSYHWTHYGALIITAPDGRTACLQGDEAAALYDELEDAPTDRAVQDTLDQYSVLLAD